MQPRARTTGRDFLRIVAVVAISLFALASSFAALGVLKYPRAGFGFGLDGLRVAGVAPGLPAAAAGILPGDRLAASTPFATRLRLRWYDAYRPGQPETIAVERNGLTRNVTLTAVTYRSPFDPNARLLIVLRLLTYVLFVVVGALLVIMRPARFTWGFFGCCIGLATFPVFLGWSLTRADAILGFVAYVVWLCAADIANVGFLAFALRFPSDRAEGWRRRVWQTLPLWLLAFVGIDAWTVVAWYTGPNAPSWLGWATVALGLGAWVVGTVALAATYRKEEPRNRKRLQWAIVGSSLGYLAWYVDQLLVGLGFGIAGRIAGFATLALPLSIAYAVLRHRVVDVRFVVNRALAYSLLASLLVAFFVLTSWVTAALLLQSHTQLLVQILLALVVGASLSRVHRRIERALEVAVFRRLRRAESELTQAIVAMRAATSREALDRLLAEVPAKALDLTFGALYRCDPNGDFELSARAGALGEMPAVLGRIDPLVAILLANRRSPVRSAGAVGFFVGGATPNAIAFFGPHDNGFDVDGEEIDLLARFVESAEPVYRTLDARSTLARRLVALLRLPETLVDDDFARELGSLVLDSLSPEDDTLLEACAILPAANAAEVAFLARRPDAGERLDELAATTPLLTRTEGRYAVHRLLQPLLAERSATNSRAQVIRCAADAFDNGEFARACELYAAVDERGDALAAVARYARGGAGTSLLPQSVGRLLHSATLEELTRFPSLLLLRVRETWPVEDDAALRVATIEVLERAREIDTESRSELATWLAYNLSESGDAETLRPLLERLGVLAAQSDAGRLRIGSGPWNLVASAERTFHYWLTGDERRCADIARELLEEAAAMGVHALDHVAYNALGQDFEPPQTSYPRFAAYAWLMQACRATDISRSIDLTNKAQRASLRGQEASVAALACVVLSEFEPSKRDEHLTRASSLVTGSAGEKFSEALAMLAAGTGSPELFAPLLRRVRAGNLSPLSIEIATASVRQGTETIAVPERESALLMALAASAQPLASASLIDMLWPDLDGVAGARALQTCVYRVRQRLTDPKAIASVAQGYRLRANVRVDLLDAERFIASLTPGACSDAFVHSRLGAVARHFARARPAAALGWEWFDPLEQRLAAVARTARQHLSEHHLGTGEYGRALSFARAMIEADEFDERARELAIRSLLAAGNTAEAWRELRLYREALAREFEAEPPAALLALFPAGEGGRALA